MANPDFLVWFRFAKDDLEAAQYLMKMPKRKLEIICYHSQQCAEKSLKALLALHDQDIPHTHDLLRYPYEMELEPGDEENAIVAAKSIFQYIKSIVK
jgi:HEPN domain-containing protein